MVSVFAVEVGGKELLLSFFGAGVGKRVVGVGVGYGGVAKWWRHCPSWMGVENKVIYLRF